MCHWIVIGVVLSILWLIAATLYFGFARSDAGHGWLAALAVAALPIPFAWVAAFLAFWTARLVGR
jgi:hypothetical protein